MRRLVVIGLGLVVLVGVTSCISVPSQPGHKPLIVGLIDKGSEANYHQGTPDPVIDLTDVASRAPAFAGVVVNANWSQLEPSQGTFDFATLDASLAAVAAYNQANPSSTLGVRLRVFAAYAAPTWAKSLDGTPITIAANPPANTGGTLGRWWEPGYRSAWAGLQQALATRYDTNPVLREVAVSSCTTLTAEPFIMSPASITSAKALGWTTADQQACLDGAFADYAPWAHTAIYYPMNPLQGSMTVTDEVMARCTTSGGAGGPWCVLANNDLSPTAATTGNPAPVYTQMNADWTANPSSTPIALQMSGPDNALYCSSIGVAVNAHALSVELWPATGTQGGFTTVPTTTLEAWRNDLITATTPTC